MRLHPRELDKLMLHYAGDLAKKRKQKGLKLNYVESVALISMEIMELAREGKHSVAELMSYGKTILKADDVLDGVASMIENVQVEVNFPDGVKLVSIHTPIQHNDSVIPGEIILKDEDIIVNANKDSICIDVVNKGDRPIQVGSHFHFFEANKLLEFDREKAYGKRLDIAAGTSVRFEPGETKSISLIDFGGNKRIFGFNNLVDGQISQENKQDSLNALKNFLK